MPASLYRLVGKPHHTEVSEVSSEPVEANEAVQSAVVEPVASVGIVNESHVESTIDVSPTETLQEETASDQTTSQSDEATDSATSVEQSQVVTWDPSWSKTQLLEVALQLNLEVTSLNTKTQIIQALTAATSN